MYLPFNNPAFEPMRHLATPPDAIPTINEPDTDMPAVLKALIAEKSVAGDTKIRLRPVTDTIAATFATQTGDDDLGQRVATTLFTDIQEQIENNKIPAWGNASMMKGQRIQQPIITTETLIQETDASLKKMGVDKASRYWIADQMLDIANQNHISPTDHPEPLNMLTETRDNLGKFRNNSPGIQPAFKKSF